MSAEITREECEHVLSQLTVLAQLARMLPVELLNRYIAAADQTDTIVPIVDPTLWMKGHRKNDIFLKMARGLRQFQESLPTIEEAAEADRVAKLVGAAGEAAP